ncbi:MAG: hypothetical protein JW822_06495 [Spirochaetales bacterium]|nr:hypothetical protein [Spirochaetales bacterium]
MKRAALVYIVFLLIGTCLFANGTENSLFKQKSTQSTYDSLEWKQAFFDELAERLLDSNIPRTTLILIFKEVSVRNLPKDPKAAAEKVVGWAKKYDLKLRKGYSHSQVALELKRELALGADDDGSDDLLTSIYIYDEYDKIKIKDKKDKKDKELKDKIKEDKDKDKDK